MNPAKDHSLISLLQSPRAVYNPLKLSNTLEFWGFLSNGQRSLFCLRHESWRQKEDIYDPI